MILETNNVNVYAVGKITFSLTTVHHLAYSQCMHTHIATDDWQLQQKSVNLAISIRHTYIHTYIHTSHVYVCMYTHIHTYTYIHRYIHASYICNNICAIYIRIFSIPYIHV